MSKQVDIVHKLMPAVHLLRGVHEYASPSWGGQFADALLGETRSTEGLVLHLIALPWKLGCAFIPPSRWMGGAATFILSLAMVGFVTVAVYELADLVSCCFGLPDSVVGLTIVAVGSAL